MLGGQQECGHVLLVCYDPCGRGGVDRGWPVSEDDPPPGRLYQRACWRRGAAWSGCFKGLARFNKGSGNTLKVSSPLGPGADCGQAGRIEMVTSGKRPSRDAPSAN